MVKGTATPSFANELKATIRAAPWYAISLAVHLLVLLLLDLFLSLRPKQERIPSIHATIDLTLPAPEESKVEIDDSKLLQPDRQHEPSIDDEEEEPDPLPEETPPEETPLGIRGGATPIKPLELSTPIRQPLAEAQKRVSDRIRKGLGRDLGGLGGIGADKILVRKGEFDSIERVLDLYGIRYTLLDDAEFRRRTLRPDQIVFLNCDQRPKLFDADVFRAFVVAGGWVMSTDWALRPYLTEAFPELVAESKARMRGHRHKVIRAVAAVERHPLLDQVFVHRRRTDLWLEAETVFFNLRSHPNITLLVYSDDTPTGAVAFVARVVKGRIVHSLAHFWQQDGNIEGITATHRMILNFLRDRFASG